MGRFWNPPLSLYHHLGIWTGRNRIPPSLCLIPETPSSAPQLHSTVRGPKPMVVPLPTTFCCRKRPLAWRNVPVLERSTLSRLASPQPTRCALSTTPSSRTARQERDPVESLISQARRSWWTRTVAPLEKTLKVPARAARNTPLPKSSEGRRNNSIGKLSCMKGQRWYVLT